MNIDAGLTRRRFLRYVTVGGVAVPLYTSTILTRQAHGAAFQSAKDPENMNDLERLQKYLQSVPVKCQNRRLKSRAFFAQANLLTSGVLSMLDSFTQAMRKFYDRSGQT